MRSSLGVSVVLILVVTACGGSSSETPMPLEPIPHAGPEPAVPREQAPTSPDGEGTESEPDGEGTESDESETSEDASERPSSEE